MSNVIAFQKPEPLVWACQCGCSTFRLYSDNTMECANCTLSSSAGEWVRELPEPADEPKQVMPETKVISLAGSPQQALRNMLRRADTDDLLAVVAIKENGRVNTWGGVDTVEGKKWIRRRLADAYGLLSMLASKGK